MLKYVTSGFHCLTLLLLLLNSLQKGIPALHTKRNKNSRIMDEVLSILNDLGLGDSEKNEMGKKELVDLLTDKILNGQTCSAWLAKLPPIPEDDLQNILGSCSHDCDDFAKQIQTVQDEAEKISDLKFSAIETISKLCLEAYINIVLKNYDQGLDVISETYKTIEHCVDEKLFLQDYAEGFRYVVDGLKIFCALEKDFKSEPELSTEEEEIIEEVDDENQEEIRLTLQKYLSDLNAFDDLNEKNRVGVLAVKQYIIGSISVSRDSVNEQIEVIKEMIRMDPEYCEWHYCLYSVLKFCRKLVNSNSKGHSSPSEEEKEAIQVAVEVTEAKFDTRILMSQLTCLAEILKYEVLTNGEVTPLRFGINNFSCNVDVTNFLRAEADKIVAVDPMSLGINLNLSKLFSSTLPSPFRDDNFAGICIKRALIFHPNSSKVNHRMALFYISDRDLPKALKYMKIAYEGDKGNVNALLDLLRLYMENIGKNDTEINLLFEEALNSDSEYYPKCQSIISELLFTKGIYMFLCGKPKETVELIFQAYTTDEKSTQYFKDIERNVKRYHWHKNTRGKNILRVTQQLFVNAHKQTSDSSRKAKLLELLEAVKVAAHNSQAIVDHNGGSARGKFRAGAAGAVAGSKLGQGRGGFRGSASKLSVKGGPNKTTDSPNSRSSSCNNINELGSGSSDTNSEQGDDDEGKNGQNVPEKSNKPRDDYAVLGVAKTASVSEISKAYCNLAKENHSDKNSSLSEAERVAKRNEMREVNLAWESLQNSKMLPS